MEGGGTRGAGDSVEPGAEGWKAGGAGVSVEREGLEAVAVAHKCGAAGEEEDPVGSEEGGLAAQGIVAVDRLAGVVEEAGAVPVAAAADPAFAVLQACGGAAKGAGEGWAHSRRG